MDCRHCHLRSGNHRPRGLCTICFRDMSIREMYPSNARGGQDYEPSEEELDATIAKQSLSLPEWWAASVANQRREEEGIADTGERCRVGVGYRMW